MRFVPRADYRELRAYDVDPTPCPIMLADNTAAFGTPPAARALLERAATTDLTRYPTTYSRPLREAIARYVEVSPDEILVGAGSDEVLSCTFRALVAPGGRVAYMHPTFVMTPVFARTNSVLALPVPLTRTGDADAAALLATGAELTYLCTPNNPTGTAVLRATLDQVVAGTRGVALVDEAYAEYAGTNIAGEAPTTDGLLVYRTCSKALGLAGARVGFAVGARPLIAELEKARGPYTVSTLSEQLATAVLTHDVAWVRERAAEVTATRDEFSAALRGHGLAPLPSAANFVLVPVPDAPAVARRLREGGIMVRAFAGLPMIGDALRITIGERVIMQRVLEALMACLSLA